MDRGDETMQLIYNKYYYNPLPKEVYIDVSKVEGHGIFAKEVIDADTELAETHIKVPLFSTFIRTPLGGFLNDAPEGTESNCCLVLTYDWDGYKIFRLVTTTKIQKDEELLLDYRA